MAATKKQLIYLINECFIKVLGTPVYHPRFWSDEVDKRRFVRHVGFFRRLHTLLCGFNSDKYTLYQFASNDRKLYLNDIRRRILAERISKQYYYIVHNKVVFDKYFSSQAQLVPKSAFIVNGKFFKMSADDPVEDFDHLVRRLRAGEVFFLKPHDGGSGRNILRVKCQDGADKFDVNQATMSLSEFEERVRSLDRFIVETRFCQRGLSHEVYPHTLNTLRIMTMVDPDTKRAFIPVALHRFGTSKSGHADNWSQGGVSVWIDVETGVMGKGVQYPYNGSLNFVSHHPDTGLQFEGKAIPGWSKVQQVVISLAEYVPFLPMLGWDIVVSDDEVFVLEANYNPDVNLVQVHRPLLRDERVRRFYRAHGVIPS